MRSECESWGSSGAVRARGSVLVDPGAAWRIERYIKECSVNRRKPFSCDCPLAGAGKGRKAGGSCDYACDYAHRPACDYACDYASAPSGAIGLKARVLAGRGAFGLDSRGQTCTQWVVNFT